MSRLEFERVDFKFRVQTLPHGAAIRFDGGDGAERFDVPSSIVEGWRYREPWSVPKLPIRQYALSWALDHWQKYANGGAVARFKDRVYLPRVAISIDDPDLALVNWEAAIAAEWQRREPLPLFVRTALTRPRIASRALTVPMRFLQVDLEPGGYDLAQQVSNMLSHFPDGLGHAVEVGGALGFSLSSNFGIPGWPTIEVLHLDSHIASAGADEPLSTASPATFGTLGWLCRFTDLNQTRLVVLRARDPDDLRFKRAMAAGLVSRGGPAVVVVGAAWDMSPFLSEFYARIVHDDPVDAAFEKARTQQDPHNLAAPMLFGGAGREDLIRISNIEVGLKRIWSAVSSDATKPEAVQINNLLLRHGRPQINPTNPLGNVFGAELNRLSTETASYIYEDSEREGFMPLVRRVGALRAAAGMTTTKAAPAFIPQPTRYVNSALWQDSGEGELTRLEQDGAFLVAEAIYHLELKVGEQDLSIRTVDATGLLEEVFKWTPDMRGTWLEVGVTGIDFDVIGDPVQEFWLPREGESEPILFAVSPRKPGVARLRFCVYFKNDLIQSFRLAACVFSPEEIVAAPDPFRLAKALDLDPETVGEAGYLTRLEYSMSDSVDAAQHRPDRTTLVANDLDGQSVITLKGSGVFKVTIPTDLKDRIKEARQELQAIQANPVADPKVRREDWPYAFDPTDNSGTDDKLKQALAQLAVVGWRLFDGVFEGDTREKERIVAALQKEEVVHVAHILLQNVIPWALMYDREYDPNRAIDRDGTPVEHDVCLAALNAGLGAFPPPACGTHAACKLHQDNIRKREERSGRRVLPETVACPLRFWGFRHIIELPPQQVAPGAKREPVRDKVFASGTAKLLRAMNASLVFAGKHGEELDAMTKKDGISAAWKPSVFDRDKVRYALDESDVDLVYFYCHARGGEDDPPPRLVFSEDPKKPRIGELEPANFGATRWPHHPLVLLNGCGTISYSPSALSPFIQKVIKDKEAAGLVGTEIPIWEPLATGFARAFLERFLRGIPAGQAMQEARRTFLMSRNPLGLAYTLYAAAELKLVYGAPQPGS